MLSALTQGLARDERDTLFLLAVVGWLIALQLPQLDAWSGALALALLAARTGLALGRRALPRPAWRVALLALVVALTWLAHGALLGQQAGVTLLTLLLALKTLELRARRDALAVFLLGFFTLLTQFFHSQSLPTAVGAAIGLLGLLAALVNANLPLGRPPLTLALRIAALMMLTGTPVMLALFLFFPRLPPLWSLPGDAQTGRSGLSEQLQIGQIARLALDERVALRLRFEREPPPQQALYLRGPVLGRFDGTTWRAAAPQPAGDAQLRVGGEALRYEVEQEPGPQRWLLLLEAAAEPPEVAGALMTAELQWIASGPMMRRLRYRASSHIDFQHGPRDEAPRRLDTLGLPEGYNPRTLALGRELAQQAARDAPAAPGAELLRLALERLRSGGYRYTLEPGVYGRDSADEFWFDRRAGFCEHIAAGFVVLMRAGGVPARIVTGYQGGARGADGWLDVRHSDAHAWAEVWLAGSGWVRVDPTAAVQPARIGSSQRLQAAEGALAGALTAIDPTLMTRLRRFWNAIAERWNDGVLGYGEARQLGLLERLGFDAPDRGAAARLLLVLISALALAGAAWGLRPLRRRDPWLALLRRARRRLRRAGYAVGEQATPRQLAQLLAAQPDGGGAALQRWLLELERQRYDPGSAIALARLRRDWRALDWPRRKSVLR